MIHDFPQAAMLEIDALIGHHPIGPALQLAAHGDVGRLCAVIVDTGVSVGIYANAQVCLPRAGDEDPQVGGQQNIRILAHRVVDLDAHRDRAPS